MTETQQGQILDELKWRGALNQLTDESGLRKLTEEKAVSVYCGTDPTGDSLHVGHLIPFMILKRFQLMGHRPVILIGGGTGSIGDPSGRNSERVLQTMETIATNKKKLTAQWNIASVRRFCAITPRTSGNWSFFCRCQAPFFECFVRCLDCLISLFFAA